MLKKLYNLRFEIFLTIQLLILFGSLLVPSDFHENILLPVLFLLSIVGGINLLSKKKVLMWFFIFHFIISLIIFGSSIFTRTGDGNMLTRLGIYFIFYVFVTVEIIKQVFRAKVVSKNVVIGLMSGYISLGFLGFFFFMAIELIYPGAFQGALIESENFEIKADGIMYYSFITLLTIGYGEIVPIVPMAQKAAILIGLAGQFYMVIVTAIVIEKYIRHTSE
ncbi:MAG: ion channel [Bacteroidota bacterium]